MKTLIFLSSCEFLLSRLYFWNASNSNSRLLTISQIGASLRVETVVRDKGRCSTNAKLILLMQTHVILLLTLVFCADRSENLVHLLPGVSVSFLSMLFHCLVPLFIARTNQRLLSASNQETSFLVRCIVTVPLLKIEFRISDRRNAKR